MNAIRDRIPAINSWLLAAAFFALPTKIAPVYLLSLVMLLLWLIEGHFAEKWRMMRGNPVFWFCQAFFWTVVLSLLWTEHMDGGIRMVRRYLLLFFFGLYLTVARTEHRWRYIGAFLAGVLMSELLAYYNWLQLHVAPNLPEGIRVDKWALETAPFVDRILYAPILAFAGYIAARGALYRTGKARLGFLALLLLTFGNLTFSAGRTGVMAFILLMALLTLQRFARRPLVALSAAVALLVALSGVVYAVSDSLMKSRLDQAFQELANPTSQVNTSVGLRYTFAVNTLRIIAENPLLGVGAGDYPAAYEKINERHTPEWVTTWNPHNQFLFVQAITGVPGTLALLLLLYAPPVLYRHVRDGHGDLRVALAFFFTVISLAESYLWRSNTLALFVLFSAVLYQPIAPRHMVSKRRNADNAPAQPASAAPFAGRRSRRLS
jgi:O-antigen ligase